MYYFQKKNLKGKTLLVYEKCSSLYRLRREFPEHGFISTCPAVASWSIPVLERRLRPHWWPLKPYLSFAPQNADSPELRAVLQLTIRFLQSHLKLMFSFSQSRWWNKSDNSINSCIKLRGRGCHGPMSSFPETFPPMRNRNEFWQCSVTVLVWWAHAQACALLISCVTSLLLTCTPLRWAWIFPHPLFVVSR